MLRQRVNPDIDGFLGRTPGHRRRELLSQASERSSSPESMTRELIRLMQPENRTQNTTLLVSDDNYLQLLVKMLNHAGIAARTADPEAWDVWRPPTGAIPADTTASALTFDPRTAEQGVPENLLLWRQGPIPCSMWWVATTLAVFHAAADRTGAAAGHAGVQCRTERARFLPAANRRTEHVPDAAVAPHRRADCCLYVIIIGIRTSGTFMPVLIAVAFVQTTLVPGRIAFLSVVPLACCCAAIFPA